MSHLDLVETCSFSCAVQASLLLAVNWSETQVSWLLCCSQVNGPSSGSDAQGRASLKGDLQEFLGGEAPLHQLDDLTKVNPVTLETGMGLPLLQTAAPKNRDVARVCSTVPQLTPSTDTPDLAPAPGNLALHLGSPGQALL